MQLRLTCGIKCSFTYNIPPLVEQGWEYKANRAEALTFRHRDQLELVCRVNGKFLE